jgi:hypothetical protein
MGAGFWISRVHAKKRLVRLLEWLRLMRFFALSGQWPDVMMMHRFDKRGCHVHSESFQK